MTRKISPVVLAAVPLVLFAAPAQADEVDAGPGVEVGSAVEIGPAIGTADDAFVDDIVDMVSEGSVLAPPSR